MLYIIIGIKKGGNLVIEEVASGLISNLLWQVTP